MKALLPFLIIAICVGMYFMYISPAWADVSVLVDQKNQYTNVLSKTQDLTAKRNAAVKAYNDIPAGDIAKLDKIIPATFDSVVFVNNVSNLAAQANLISEEFKTNDPKTADRSVTLGDAGPYQTISINVRLLGSIDEFIKCLKSLESSLSLVDVVSLSINTGKGKTPTDPTLEFMMELHTYALK